jgi:hypothetical protein
MFITANSLGLDALALVVTFGMGFLVWTLAHLFGEAHPQEEPGPHLFIATRQRR